MYLDQFTESERLVTKAALIEFIKKCKDILWEQSHKFTPEERKRAEQEIEEAKDALEKIENNKAFN